MMEQNGSRYNSRKLLKQDFFKNYHFCRSKLVETDSYVVQPNIYLFVVLIAPFLQYILLSSRRTTPLLPMPLSLFFKKFLKFLQDFFPNEIEYYFTKLLTNPQIYWY